MILRNTIVKMRIQKTKTRIQKTKMQIQRTKILWYFLNFSNTYLLSLFGSLVGLHFLFIISLQYFQETKPENETPSNDDSPVGSLVYWSQKKYAIS